MRASTHYPTVYGKDTIATDNPGKPHILSWRVLRDPYLRGGGVASYCILIRQDHVTSESLGQRSSYCSIGMGSWVQCPMKLSTFSPTKLCFHMYDYL